MLSQQVSQLKLTLSSVVFMVRVLIMKTFPQAYLQGTFPLAFVQAQLSSTVDSLTKVH